MMVRAQGKTDFSEKKRKIITVVSGDQHRFSLFTSSSGRCQAPLGG
jgi:hypothetical protein